MTHNYAASFIAEITGVALTASGLHNLVRRAADVRIRMVEEAKKTPESAAEMRRQAGVIGRELPIFVVTRENVALSNLDVIRLFEESKRFSRLGKDDK